MLSDIEGQLKFPSEIVETRLRPDLVIFSRSAKTVVWWELTVPSEDRISNRMSTNSTDTVVCRLRFRRKVGAVIMLQSKLELEEWLRRVWRELREGLVLKEES